MSVTTTLYPYREMVLLCEGDRDENIGGALWQHDDGWMLLESKRIPGQTRFMIPLIAWYQGTSLEMCSQVLKAGCINGKSCMH
jgi:hypothetical protein